MRLIVYLLIFAGLSVCFGSCAGPLATVANVDPPATTANYTITVKVVPGYCYSEIVYAAGGSSPMEVVDLGLQPFTMRVLRFRYEQVQRKDISKMQQRLSRCRGILSASITND